MGLSSLLNLSASMIPQTIDTMKFMKSDRVLNIEQRLSVFAQGKIEGYTDSAKVSVYCSHNTNDFSKLIRKLGSYPLISTLHLLRYQ